MKPLTDNIERFVFGVLVIGGYFMIGLFGSIFFRDNQGGLQITHDAMLTIGPLIGIIVQSIWKTGKVDKTDKPDN